MERAFRDILTTAGGESLAKALPMAFHPTMDRQSRIAHALSHALSPISLDVVDDSNEHAGHAGARPGGETHYTVNIVSPAFAGKSRVERHRMVNAALAGEFAAGLHALALIAKAPGE
jgi:BolA protein